MDLYLQTLPSTPWQQHKQHEAFSKLGSPRFSSGQHYLLASSSSSSSSIKRPSALKAWPWHLCMSPPLRGRCRANGESSAAAEGGVGQAHQETPPPSSDPPQTKAVSDPYLGWANSDESLHHGSTGMSGWVKLGGIAVLTIGFALGARFAYTKKEASRGFTNFPPAKEQIASVAMAQETAQPPAVEKVEEPLADTESKEIHLEGTNPGTSSLEAASEVFTEGTAEIAEQGSAGNTSVEGGSELDLDNSEGTSESPVVLEESIVHNENTPPDSMASELPTPTSPHLDNNELSGEEMENGREDSMHDLQPDAESSNAINSEPVGQQSLQLELTTAQEPSLPLSRDADQHPSSPSDVTIIPIEETGKGTFDQDDESALSEIAELVQLFSPADLIAPSVSSAAWHKTVGRVVVPATVDHAHEQVLAALKALKVIEGIVQPGDVCTRREYARWLMASSAILSRSPAHKVFPAMYIEDTTKLAFDDVSPQDPDFPFIQGLAEAGLVSNRLLADDRHTGEELFDEDKSNFFPDSPLTRQDLVTWKIAFERKRTLTSGIDFPAGKEALQAMSGFIDLDKIDRDAWPALVADMSSGESSIIASAFGYTRRFQPGKPVTKAQAAMALATGDAQELVSEELARLEAESIAEAAMAAELALESGARNEVAAAFDELLQLEREKQESMANSLEKTNAELQRVKADREEENMLLLRERAALESEKEFVLKLRHDMEEQALALSHAKVVVELEKEQVEKLLAAAEEERGAISKVLLELEIEKSALILARTWVEEEARKAAAHAKVLEEARKRWEIQDQVHVDNELNELDSQVPSPIEDLQIQSLKESIEVKLRASGKAILDVWIRFLQFMYLIFCALRKRSSNLAGRINENLHVAKERCVSVTNKAVEGFQQTVPNTVIGATSTLREGTVKAVSECKGGAEWLVQKFKVQ